MLVTFSLGLIAVVGAVFTRVIAARVPEQRATLEKLIADRTGLAVRFDNVRFAWDLDGTSAVFERVELSDPVHGRVRVVAPELRVELDTWDFLKHQQFSLGHVKLASPDIEIIGDAEPVSEVKAAATRSARKQQTAERRADDEATSIRRLTAWAELMPVGRVEVEAARVHLLRRGDRAPRHSFTLSQALVSRRTHSINAFGTMLLSQDIGQSLFISTKLENLGSPDGVSGELRFIARRVLLDKLNSDVARGRGTLDAKLELRGGMVHNGKWQASARELEFTRGMRFDHFTVNGVLSRERGDVVLDFTDLQVTRGARLERAPRLSARLALDPGSTRVAHTTMAADRVPFMAAELIAGVFAPQLERHLRGLPDDWTATAGELRAAQFDSRSGSFRAQLSGAELTRAADRARVGHLAAAIEMQDSQLRLAFDPANAMTVWMPEVEEARTLRLEGALSLQQVADMPQLHFEGLKLTSGDGMLSADGIWGDGQFPAKPLLLAVSSVDRALLGDVCDLLALQDEVPQLTDIHEGVIVSGQAQLLPAVDAEGRRLVNWQRSRGAVALAGLSNVGEDAPRLTDAAGKLEFSRGNTRLRLSSGQIEDLLLTDARIEWPRQGTPRLQASLQGELPSALLRRAFAEQGLAKAAGEVTLEADARGEQALRDPKLWRLTARIGNGSLPLAADLPPVERLAGTVRYAEGELRAVALEGQWLGGPIKLESRRGTGRGPLTANLSGSADASPLLRLLGQAEAAGLVNGQLAWSGTLQKAEDHWSLSLDSNLAGVESRLPEPFDKTRARQVVVHAQLRLDARGVSEFGIASGRDTIRGQVNEGVTSARFEVQGVAGELRGADSAVADPRLTLERLELRRAPLVLAAAGAMLPEDTELVVRVADLRHDSRSLGGLEAGLSRVSGGVEFSLESAAGSPHELSATGNCLPAERRCSVDFKFDTRKLPELLAVRELPSEWPMQTLRAAGELSWPSDTAADIARQLSGRFEVETQGVSSSHQLVTSATLAGGQIELANLQGTGPEIDQAFRGSGRIGLLARTYDLTIDFERLSLAATAMPSPARAGITRAWSVLRGSAERGGWTGGTTSRRVQWHGSWGGDSLQMPD